MKLKPLKDQTIVITGGSSGIGLATAKMALKKKANVVIAARSQAALSDIVNDLNEHAPGKIICVTADVSSKTDIEKIIAAAIKNFGGFDTWVNNAGVSVIGRLEEIDIADHRQLFETNFWGLVNGSLAAVEHLKNKGGALINLGSEVSDIAFPLQGMYSASKHAVKGFTEALRVELADENAPVSVTLIKPAAIGTPFFEHAKNYTDHDAKAPPPVYRAEEVAHAILHAAQHSARDIYIGSASKMLSSVRSVMPNFSDWAAKKMMRTQLAAAPNPGRPDNLYAGESSGQVKGINVGHPRPSIYTRATLNPGKTLALIFTAHCVYSHISSKFSRKC